MALDERTMMFVLNELYGGQEGAEYHAFHPRFLIDHVKAISAFEDVPPELRPDFPVRAWGNLFTSE